MRFIDCKRGAGSVTDSATLPDGRRVSHSMCRCGLIYMAANTRGRKRLYRVHVPLRIKNVADSSRRGLRIVYVAHGAITSVARAALRAQCRVADVGVVLISAVNAVDQQVEVNPSCWLTRIISICGKRRIVAKYAHLRLVAVIAVEGKREMTLIAGSGWNRRSPRLHRRSID